MADELTAEKLREELHYDPATGLFTWLKHGWANRVGTVAGGLSDRGYVVIVIAGKLRKAHRLAWLYMTGEWPREVIDHRNTVKHDNRWHNLRDATREINAQNERAARFNSASGLLGVTYRPNGGYWKAQIHAGGKKRTWGRFATAESAHAAYIEEKRRVHAGCTL